MAFPAKTERNAVIGRDRLTGMLLKDIAKKHTLSVSTVRNILDSVGIRIRTGIGPNKLEKSGRNRMIYEDRLTKMSISSLCDKYNLEHRTIRMILHREKRKVMGPSSIG